jgi:hypothetical protein
VTWDKENSEKLELWTRMVEGFAKEWPNSSNHLKYFEALLRVPLEIASPESLFSLCFLFRVKC